MRLIIILTFLVQLGLPGCSTSGGPIAGFPVAAPKALKGQIKGDTYTSIDGKFSVLLPYEAGSPYWKYMKAKDGKDGDGLTYVDFGTVFGPSFGPAIFDDNIFSVVYVRHPAGWNRSSVC